MDDRRGNNSRGPGPIPKRWLNCPRTSTSFIAEKFLAFKTPLSDRFASQLEPQHYFQPETVFSFVKMHKVSYSGGHQVKVYKCVYMTSLVTCCYCHIDSIYLFG